MFYLSLYLHMMFFFILFIILVGGGRLAGKAIGNALFPDKKDVYIDKTVHHHHYDTKHYHEHKNINIIDDETKKKILEIKKSSKI